MSAKITSSVLAQTTDCSEAAQSHVAFWKHGGYEVARNMVRTCINKRAGDDAESEEAQQPRLPGWNFLRTHYTVRRQDKETGEVQIVGVAIEHLTSLEIKRIAKRMRKSAKRLNGHADELERFDSLRGSEDAA